MDNKCTRCQGEGKTFSKGFTTTEGKVYEDQWHVCSSCDGAKEFPPVNTSFILDRIVAGQGKNKGKLRAAFPAGSRFSDVQEGRAYYVWRMARFHGGKDVTMPMTADLVVRGDPFRKELDVMADAVAKKYFGTDLAAAMRWKGLLF